MNMKKIATISLAAVAALGMSSTFAGNADAGHQKAAACLGHAFKDAALAFDEATTFLKANGSNIAMSDLTMKYDSTETNTSDVDGLAYFQFGAEDSGNNYIAVAYLGKNCGVLTNTKVYCQLKHGTTNIADNTDFNDDSVDGTNFWMDCQVCSAAGGIHAVMGTGVESASNHAHMTKSALATLGVHQAAAIKKAPHHGMHVSSSVTTWALDATCHHTVVEQGGP